jgi:hypothetical protein
MQVAKQGAVLGLLPWTWPLRWCRGWLQGVVRVRTRLVLLTSLQLPLLVVEAIDGLQNGVFVNFLRTDRHTASRVGCGNTGLLLLHPPLDDLHEWLCQHIPSPPTPYRV